MANTPVKSSRRGKNWGALIGLTEAKLRDLYQVQLLSDREIGALYDATGEGVAYHRKRWGIPTITLRQRRERRTERSGPSLDDLTPVKLADLYSRMGDRQIAALYGVAKPAIARLRERWGIVGISKSERATSREPLSDEQKEILIGIVLGDGHIMSRGVFKVSHAYHQYEYLCQAHGALAPIARPLYYEEKEMPESGELCPAFGFQTVQHTWLKAMRRVFYPDGEKVFPAALLDQLSERSLAYWYFDDGHLGDDGLPLVALGKHTGADAQAVCNRVANRFGLQAYLSPKSAPNCQIMTMRAVSTERFYRMVRDYASPDMLYKIPTRFWPPDAKLSPKVRTREQIELPKALAQRCRADTQDEDLVEDLLGFWRKAGFPYHVARPEHLQVLARMEGRQLLQQDALKIRQVGQSSCQAFMPHIWEAHVQGEPSPKALFDDDDLLRKVIRRGLRAGVVFNAMGMRRALRFYRLTSVYNFRPASAKALVDRFCPAGGLVFDPCGGWGGRMMGTLLSGAFAKYVCCEPSSQTVRGLHELKMWMAEHVPGAGERVEINPVPAEDFDPPEADMVFTSPPYWKKEHYADESTQAGLRYPTYEVWAESFLRPVLDRCVRALKPGGWLVLNVDDFAIGDVTYKLIQDVKDIVEELGLRDPETLRYVLPSPTKEDNHEVVLAWPKGVRVVGTLEPAPLDVVVGETEKTATTREPLGRVCVSCQRKFAALRKDALYCSEACGARHRRKQRRATSPKKAHRTVTCKACLTAFEIPLTGGVPNYCPLCAIEKNEEAELEARTKICAYRHCGRSFLDYSAKNSSKFCHVEHRRREKLFRSGQAKDLSYFRKPDPILG